MAQFLHKSYTHIFLAFISLTDLQSVTYWQVTQTSAQVDTPGTPTDLLRLHVIDTTHDSTRSVAANVQDELTSDLDDLLKTPPPPTNIEETPSKDISTEEFQKQGSARRALFQSKRTDQQIPSKNTMATDQCLTQNHQLKGP